MEVGYKVFNPDWTCRGFKYEVGKTYEMENEPILCKQGFHYCVKLIDCFNYYQFNNNNKVAKIIAHGTIDGTDEDKHCTNKIEIVEEISWFDVLNMVNTGKDNVGLGNSGNFNSGYYNSGDRNSGDYNSGNWNSGDRNSGYYNSGYWNSGDYNATNHSSGVFNTKEEKITMFNKKSNWTFEDWSRSEARSILMTMPIPYASTEFVVDYEMTKKEKAEHPEYTVIGGYLKVVYKDEDKQEWWDNLSEANKKKR